MNKGKMTQTNFVANTLRSLIKKLLFYSQSFIKMIATFQNDSSFQFSLLSETL